MLKFLELNKGDSEPPSHSDVQDNFFKSKEDEDNSKNII